MELVISLGSDLPENTPHLSYKDQSVYVLLNTIPLLRSLTNCSQQELVLNNFSLFFVKHKPYQIAQWYCAGLQVG
jgi:hypothetical protein